MFGQDRMGFRWVTLHWVGCWVGGWLALLTTDEDWAEVEDEDIVRSMCIVPE